MPRRSSFASIMNQIARDSARARRHDEQTRIKHQRYQERLAKDAARLKLMNEKQTRLEYLETRSKEVEDNNSDLHQEIDALSSILDHTLSVNQYLRQNRVS